MQVTRYTARMGESHITHEYLYMCIHGKPKPLERGRIRGTSPRQSTRISGEEPSPSLKRIFNPNKKVQEAFEGAAMEALRPIYDTREFPVFLDLPVELKITFHFKRPLTHFLRKIRHPDYLLTDYRHLKPQKSGGDLDNHIKFVLDCMEGILYHNDRQVIKLIVEKEYCDGEDDKTEITCKSEGYDPVTQVEWLVSEL